MVPIQEDGRDYIVLRDPQGYAESMLAIAREAVPLLTLFDGERSPRQLLEEITAQTGEPMEPDGLLQLIDMLDQAHLLESEEFQRHRLEAERDFQDQAVREATLAGVGYPDDPEELDSFLEGLLNAPPAEDFEPETPVPNLPAMGMIAPHIDYARGGLTYGRAYRVLRDHLPPVDEGPLLVGVIGVAHQGAGAPMVVAPKDFRTPYGDVPYYRPGVERLRSRLSIDPCREQWVHRQEHSVELQLPWLQYLLRGREWSLLPLLAGVPEIGTDDNTPASAGPVRELIDTLEEIEREHQGPVLWIASVDLAHVGLQFGDMHPVDDAIRSAVEAVVHSRSITAPSPGRIRGWH